jgi:hypothetical protein
MMLFSFERKTFGCRNSNGSGWDVYIKLLFCLLLAGPTAAPAGLIPEPRTYRPLDMFGNGFKDTVQKDGTWRIIANSRPYDGRGFAMDMALHRAAELAAAADALTFRSSITTERLGRAYTFADGRP